MSEEPQRDDLAPIIPIGTRGKPGRGSRTSASAAARGLAPKAPRPHKRPEPGPAPEGGTPEGIGRWGHPVGSTSETDSGREVASPAGPNGVAPTTNCPDGVPPSGAGPGAATAVGAATSGLVHLADRNPLNHIPLADIQHAIAVGAREVFGDNWERELAGFLAFLRRRLTGDYEIDEFGYDPELTTRFLLAAMRPLKEKWFRIEVRGVENIPAEGGALIVSNHSGTIPIDAVMTTVVVQEHAGRPLRSLAADLVFRTPFLAPLARKGGATLACTEDAERLLGSGHLVGVWPEGFKGVGKPFSERYRLQRFGRGGFVAAALRTGVPIVPLSVVGAEEIYPLVGNIPALARVLGLPYIPITPLFPLLGPLGAIPLPSKWLMEFGEPIRTDEYDEESVEDPMLVFNLTDQVRETIQQTLYVLLSQRQSVFK